MKWIQMSIDDGKHTMIRVKKIKFIQKRGDLVFIQLTGNISMEIRTDYNKIVDFLDKTKSK